MSTEAPDPPGFPIVGRLVSSMNQKTVKVKAAPDMYQHWDNVDDASCTEGVDHN